jgi:hypothetical protein
MEASAYGPAVVALLEGVPPAPLEAGKPNEQYRAELTALTPERLFAQTGKPIRDRRMAQCCLAGLWLRHNFFEESHAFSQEIETPSGGFWHGILHRREPDYGNARYWFRRVGNHPVFPELNHQAMALGWPATSKWDPDDFIDQIEQSLRLRAEKSSRQRCLAIQQIEWELLFDHCWRHSLA